MLRLRPLRLDDLDALMASRRADAEGDVSPGTRRRLRRRIQQQPTLDRDGWLELAVELDGRLIGDVQARRPKRALPEGICEIGITLFAGERGKGSGRRAVELFTDLLFREQGVARVQASTSVGNAPMRRVLERVGYSLEGIMRGFWPVSDGGREDYALYAVTRADWEARTGSLAAAR